MIEEVKTRKIEWHPKNKKISQIAKEGLEFALVSEEYKQIHQLVWCKDFLQDVYHGCVNDSMSSVYGFTYDPKKDPKAPMDRTRILVTNWKDRDLENRVLKRCLPFLHEVEDLLKVSKTIVEKCENVPLMYKRSGIWLFDSSKRWFKSPPMISLLCLLIRIGLVREENDNFETTITKIKKGEIKSYFSLEKDQDMYQVARAEKGIKKIIKFGDRKLFHSDMKLNYPPLGTEKNGQKVSIYTIHDYSGIVAYSENTTKLLFPHWHRLDESKT